jgi:uncharacterized HAD superfamily protein
VSRPRAGIDLDGVVYRWCDTVNFLLEHYRGVRGLGEWTSWDYLEDTVKLPKEDKDWLWTEGVSLGMFRHGNCYRGSFAALDRLAITHDVVILTARPRAAITDTLAWLAFHRVAASEVHVLDGQPKSSVPCDWYVDDSAANARELHLAGKEVLLWDRPWNQDDYVHGVVRVYSWENVLERAQEDR